MGSRGGFQRPGADSSTQGAAGREPAGVPGKVTRTSQLPRRPSSTEHEDPRLLALLHELEASMPAGSYQIVDHWDADACAVGVSSQNEPRRLVYISTYDQEDGAYAFECEAPLEDDADDYQVVDEGNGLKLDTLLMKISSHLLRGKGLKVQYEEPVLMSHEDAERALQSTNPEETCAALLSIALHDPDWRWAQEQCLRCLQHASEQVRALAPTCLGHVARIHGHLDMERVLPVLTEFRRHPALAGRVEDALDDIVMFLEHPRHRTP